VPIAKTFSGTPIYLKCDDTFDASYTDSPKLRRIRVYMKPDDTGILVVACSDNNQMAVNQSARFTAEQAVQLRDAIDEFLADQHRPRAELVEPLYDLAHATLRKTTL
jgi:hypothetical protein